MIVLEHLKAYLDGKPLAPTSIVASGVVMGGLGEIGFENLPKGVLIPIILGMFGIISFFAKRDYGRINSALTTSEARADAAEALAEKRHTAMLLQFNDFVMVKDNSRSLNHLHQKTNKLDTRVVVLETKAGLREHVLPDTEDQS